MAPHSLSGAALGAFAATSGTTTELDYFAFVMGLLGGLAIFLFGMELMADALKAAAGDRMRSILAKLTTNRFMGVITGAFVTAVIQSSSVTTVLVVGFISAGLMSMTQSIGVIMGANIGTTITAQIVAFKVTKYALLMVAVGFGTTFVAKTDKMKHRGEVLLGLGLVFFGMAVMGSAMKPLRSFQPFLDWMITMENPLTGIMAGALFTAVVQSSSATTGVVIVMATQGLISLPAGIALSFGANIGTCVTALLASIGKPREALRSAMVHVLFNILGVLVWLAFIDNLAEVVTAMSPAHPELAGTDRLAAETPRQIANAHTIFNIANTVIFIGFAGQFARAVEAMVPDRSMEEEEAIRAKYLDLELLSTPALALDRVRLEILHMGDTIREMHREILPALLHGDKEQLTTVERMDDRVDILHGHVITYLGQISRGELTEIQTEEFIKLMEAANSLENIGDIIETNLVSLGFQRIDKQIRVSEQTEVVISDFHRAVSRALDASLAAVTQKSVEAAVAVVEMKTEINRLMEAAQVHEAQRLIADEPNRIAAYTLETDILQSLKRVYYFCKRIGRGLQPPRQIS